MSKKYYISVANIILGLIGAAASWILLNITVDELYIRFGVDFFNEISKLDNLWFKGYLWFMATMVFEVFDGFYEEVEREKERRSLETP